MIYPVKSKEPDTLRLDLVAGLVTGALLLLILLVLIVGTQIGIRVSAQLSSNRILGPLWLRHRKAEHSKLP